MRPLRQFIFLAALLATLPLPQTSVAQDRPASLWELNNSVLGLYANGTERVLRYEEPRLALQQLGVRPGALFFKGTRSGDTYSGTAYVFHERCGEQPFEVEGTVNDDERLITFTGEQPVTFDAQCEVSDVKDVEFEVTFLRSLAPPLVVGSIDRDPSPANESEEI